MFTAKQGWDWYTETTAHVSDLMRWALLATVGVLAVAARGLLPAFSIAALAFVALDVLQQFVRACGFRAAAEKAEKLEQQLRDHPNISTLIIEVSMSDAVLRLASRLFMAKVSLFFGIVLATAVNLGMKLC